MSQQHITFTFLAAYGASFIRSTTCVITNAMHENQKTKAPLGLAEREGFEPSIRY